MSKCNLCPRSCGAERNNEKTGFCGTGDRILVSRVSLHAFEEPSISGKRGSGTIFFLGCNLRCVFCQNKGISRGEGAGREISAEELAKIMLALEHGGAHNVNLVTPTHFTEQIAEALELARPKLHIPIIWNSSAYESAETLKKLEGLVDVYLPDFKYASAELAEKYSSAPDYPAAAADALLEMFRQTGEIKEDGGGMITKGVIVRHLVLPSHRKDSIAVLEKLSAILPVDKIKLSLMSQYTPDFALDCPFRELHRRLTTFEYESVLRRAEDLGFDGYFQRLSSSDTAYTPDFDDAGLLGTYISE
ncbi:MAG: radical SAM protein [Clostridia bacterium]|nr:radical SAM protein [Clostridia bacterium]